ncbi:MAG: hypothetical protein KGI54_13185 [Pseudomonadota bacterium]|nr:hypothetical protein [Pseudomonadota bacterium]
MSLPYLYHAEGPRSTTADIDIAFACGIATEHALGMVREQDVLPANEKANLAIRVAHTRSIRRRGVTVKPSPFLYL